MSVLHPNFVELVRYIFLYGFYLFMNIFGLFSPHGLFCFCSFLLEPICKREYYLSCLGDAIQLGTPTCPGPEPASSLAAHFPLHPPTSVHAHLLLFAFPRGTPAATFFILWAIWHRSSTLACGYRHSPMAIKTVGESRNSGAFRSLPLLGGLSIYPITPPLSTAQGMFASKHVPVLVLHVKYPGFPW